MVNVSKLSFYPEGTWSEFDLLTNQKCCHQLHYCRRVCSFLNMLVVIHDKSSWHCACVNRINGKPLCCCEQRKLYRVKKWSMMTTSHRTSAIQMILTCWCFPNNVRGRSSNYLLHTCRYPSVTRVMQLVWMTGKVELRTLTPHCRIIVFQRSVW